jgi:hypothetical protein
MHSKRMSWIAILTALVLMFSAAMPGTAFAQDPMPPPDAPLAEESQPADETVTEAVPPADETVVEVSPPQDEVTLPELLEAAPEGTEVVVLDENGTALPLTSDAAATILVSGDPMWCAAGDEPGDPSCTPGYSSFTDLMVDLNDGSESGDGTIFVSYLYTYNDGAATTDDSSGILIDWYGGNWLESLTIQGGWDFGSNAVVGTSTIGTSMDILDWGDSYSGITLTINDLLFNNGGGLYIGDAEADVTLNNVEVTGASSGTGAYIETEGSLAVNNSRFNDNSYAGLVALSEGAMTLNGVTASDNEIGIAVASLDGDVSLMDIVAHDNYLVGVAAGSIFGDVALTSVEANTGLLGVAAGSVFGDVSLTSVVTDEHLLGTLAISLFGDTSLQGVSAQDNLIGVVAASLDGDTTLNNVVASNNGLVGAVALAGGDVYVGYSVFNGNDMLGLAAISLFDGNVTIDHVTAQGNDVGVVMGSLDTDIDLLPFFPYISISAVPSAVGSSTVICSTLTGNDSYGLITLSDTTVSSTDLSGNGIGESMAIGGTVVEGSSVECDAGGGSDYMANRRAALIPITGCADVVLKEGDVTAVLHNLCGYDVGLDAPDLPGALPSGSTQASGVTVIGPDLPVAGGSIDLSFPAPSGVDGASLAVLQWNGTAWVEVPGGTIMDGMFVVTVTEAGPCVLVQQ